jgi:hypothetical protein
VAEETLSIGSEQPATSWSARIRSLVRAIEENDERKVEDIVLRLSRRHRLLAPLALAIGAFAMLFDALKLLISNWRLTLVTVIPAMWIWLAMYDLKAHVLHGKQFNAIRGPVLIPLNLAIVAITVGCFFLNAVFAFAIAQQSRPPQVRPAIGTARQHLKPIVVSGAIAGLLVGFATTVSPRWGRPWFTIILGVVIGLLMLCYVAVPARLLGGKPRLSRRDKVSTTVAGGVLSATVCTPPYVMGRIGVLLLGTKVLWILGVVLIAVGVTLQAGATGAVRAIKMSVSLTGARNPP